MKKIFRLIAALAATTVAFSCMEEANPETPETGKTNYDGPVTTLEFTLDELETKTAWDGENHTWSEGDMIKLIWMDAEGKTGDVEAEVVDGKVTAQVGVADTYYAVYPETTAYTLVVAEGQTEPQFSVTIPKIQDGSFRQANIMAAKTAASEKVLAFKNLTHIFKFELSEGCEYNFFRFCTNSTRNQESRYAGTPSLITFGDDDVTVGAPADGTGNTSYVCARLDEGAKGPFYLGVRAGAVTDKGFGVLASKARKESNFTGGLLTTTAVETTRSKITNLGILDNYISDDWYITEKGTGSGKSWADAAGIELLVNLMQNKTSAGETYSGNGTTDIYRLIDAKIHVAAGTYNIFEANGGANMNVAGLAFNAEDRYKSTKITIIGGYPAAPAEGDVPTIGENGSATIFTTNKDENNRTFNFDNSIIGYLVFDGISFKTAEVNAVGTVNFSSNVQGEATFNNCYFSVQSTNTNQGAAFRSTAGSRVTITLNKCTFASNTTAGNGGAIFKNNGKSIVKFVECDFISNSVTSDKARGGVGQLSAAVNITFEKCNFTGNSATTYGGCIYMNESSTATFTDCNFTENTAKYGGALANEIGTLIVTNCNFSSNGSLVKAGHGGAIISYDEYPSDNSDVKTGVLSSLYVYNSSFDSNFYYRDMTSDTSNGGAGQGTAIKIHGDGMLAVVNSSFNNHKGSYGGVIRTRSGAYPGSTAYLISCTGNSNKAFQNQNSNGYVYNSILNGYGTGGSPVTSFYNTIKTTELWTATGTKSETPVTFADQIGAFANGVFPVTASSAAATNGMSSQDLAALGAEGSALLTAMPLFDASKLTVDQKGNSREGKTIMGAYVGE